MSSWCLAWLVAGATKDKLENNLPLYDDTTMISYAIRGYQIAASRSSSSSSSSSSCSSSSSKGGVNSLGSESLHGYGLIQPLVELF